ncbi:serine/threonine protein kinase [Herbiconiux sp. CPCC 205763]|uniref:non-specific serine/threonine protein kinase n=1 Tax=Herbiconiux aconitum TaxID=2970913 RepID=A0ABT2GUK2_9MICO|nr:serine/threonine-protein kinase [Herbiconiux aconitum]MCS5719893.1 serine/threonine protein kinase [Herbiconiux aconitum]
MVRRLPSPPPPLPGFTSVRVLGSGGFADVFLFEQNMPRRQVAVKVMLPEVVNEQVRRMFQVEADLMAKLSAHPSILTVYEAGVSSDGRPYLVMELCSSSLGQRYRNEPLPVAEVLRIGVKIAGALHTAHEQGILHRDVKPSNILLTAYGAPVLSDFGISASTRGNAAVDVVGMSIPWSAPEVLSEETQGSVASEVWALSATLYSLLAGRSPFEQPGSGSSPGDLARRIAKAKLAPIGRSDVPGSLERILARGMAKDPAQRPSSALELLRELQAVETELGLSQTSAEIAMAEWAGDYARDSDDRTVLHAAGATGSTASARRRRASASTATRAGGGPGAAGIAPPSGGSADRHPTRTSRSDTGERWGTSAGTGRPDGTGRGRGIRIAVIVAASVVVAGGLAAGGIALSQQDAGRSIPSVGEISAATTGGRILFSWNDPGLGDGDSYRVTTGAGQSSVQRSNEFAAFPTDGSSVCISVAVVRAGKSGAASSEKCAALE